MIHAKQLTKKEQLATVGGLSTPSKMPCYSYNLPAKECAIGSLLRKRKDSPCAGCYALKGRYVFSNVQRALYRRLDLLRDDLDDWRDNMIRTIRRCEKSGYFRWHDSGDIQSFEHLVAINDIAHCIPSIQFWLPTVEHKMVADFLDAHEAFAPNLTVRLSSWQRGTVSLIDAPEIKSLPVSTIGTTNGWQCKAPDYEGKCNKCRACWSKKVKHVNYEAH